MRWCNTSDAAGRSTKGVICLSLRQLCCAVSAAHANRTQQQHVCMPTQCVMLPVPAHASMHHECIECSDVLGAQSLTQQLPHAPWFLTMPTALCSRQSIVGGGSTFACRNGAAAALLAVRRVRLRVHVWTGVQVAQHSGGVLGRASSLSADQGSNESAHTEGLRHACEVPG